MKFYSKKTSYFEEIFILVTARCSYQENPRKIEVKLDIIYGFIFIST